MKPTQHVDLFILVKWGGFFLPRHDPIAIANLPSSYHMNRPNLLMGGSLGAAASIRHWNVQDFGFILLTKCPFYVSVSSDTLFFETTKRQLNVFRIVCLYFPAGYNHNTAKSSVGPAKKSSNHTHSSFPEACPYSLIFLTNLSGVGMSKDFRLYAQCIMLFDWLLSDGFDNICLANSC